MTDNPNKNQTQEKTLATKPSPPKDPAPKPSATIKDKNLLDSLLYLKKNNLLPDNNKTKIKFETTKEAENSKKEDVVDIIKEKLNSIKQDITELQKAGYNLHLETIKLIEVPLKQKIWTSTLLKKDLENIFKILKEVNEIVLPLKQKNEKEIAEKERLEKMANQKEQKLEQQKTPQS